MTEAEKELWTLMAALVDDNFSIIGVTEEGGLIFAHKRDSMLVVI